MNITIRTIALLAFVPLVCASLEGKEKPFESVERTVRERTKQEIRWQRDLAAREESRSRVGALLQSPVTLSMAVQIALLNNRGLQASFEEIGLSFADLREARTLANPNVDLQIKFRSSTHPSADRMGFGAEFSKLAHAAAANARCPRATRRRADAGLR